MKKIHLLLYLIAFFMFSCSSGNEKIIANLKAAVDGEANASAKYAAFAQQALKEEKYAIAALFQATSKAEAIHIRNHQHVLEKLGIRGYEPIVQVIEVKSTAENLQMAIEGETYEFTIMYPDFIKTAKARKMQDAVTSYNFAIDAERGHAKLYIYALENINDPAALAGVYYVCPVCGNTYARTPAERCELCRTPSDKFLVFEAEA